MQSTAKWITCVLLSTARLFTGCGDDSGKNNDAPCTLGTNAGCSDGQVCEETTNDKPACFAPMSVKGQVTDALAGDPVAGALVVARDANGAAVSGTAKTDAAGNYKLIVPAERDAAGVPLTNISYTLRADAGNYQSFPVASSQTA